MIVKIITCMKLYEMWEGFSKEQYSYITNLIKNSDAQTICELGTFVGSTAKQVWDEIKDTGKELYLVDNYAFLPEDKREKFFHSVKHTIDPKTKNIKCILQNSHTYDWTKHNFIIFGHHDADHMLPDLNKLIYSYFDYVLLGDGTPRCFQRTKATYELISSMSGHGLRPLYYLQGLILLGRKNIKCDLPITKDYFFGHEIGYMPKPKGRYLKALDELKRIY